MVTWIPPTWQHRFQLFFLGDLNKLGRKVPWKIWSTAIHWPRLRAFNLPLVPHLGRLGRWVRNATGKFVKTWQESKSAKGKEVKCEAQRVSDLFLGVWKTWTFVICDIFSMRSFSNKRKADLNTRFSLDNVDEYHFWVDPKFPEVQRLKMICSEHSSQHESKEQNIRKASRMTYLSFRWKHLRAAGKLDRSVKMVLTPQSWEILSFKGGPKMSMLSGANFETEVPKEVSIPWKSQVRNLMSSTSFLNRGKIIFQTYLF